MFLLALTIFVVAELVTAVGLKNKASGLTSFGYEPESGIVEHEDGRVEFLRSWGRRFYDQVITAEPSESVHRIFTLGDSVPRGKNRGKELRGPTRTRLGGSRSPSGIPQSRDSGIRESAHQNHRQSDRAISAGSCDPAPE